MNAIALGICIFLKMPYLLFKYNHKEDKKMGKRQTILEKLCYIFDLLNIFAMCFLASISTVTMYYIWLVLCLLLLVIYYIYYYRYFTSNNLRILYAFNKINLPTVLIEIAIPVITGFITLNPVLLVSAFAYGVLHYHLELEVQKRIRFR